MSRRPEIQHACFPPTSGGYWYVQDFPARMNRLTLPGSLLVDAASSPPASHAGLPKGPPHGGPFACLLPLRIRNLWLPAGREPFLPLCVERASGGRDGKILLDHYCRQRRPVAGDERLRHQPLTRCDARAVCRRIERPRTRRPLWLPPRGCVIAFNAACAICRRALFPHVSNGAQAGDLARCSGRQHIAGRCDG